MQNEPKTDQDARARVDASSPSTSSSTEPQTEGQRALRLVPGSLSEIAEKLGTDKSTVGFWRSGQRTPKPAARERIQVVFGIAPEAWDRRPVGASNVTRAAPKPRGETSRESTLETTLWMIGELRSQLEEEDLPPSERRGLTDNMTKLLALRGRLEEKGELLESRIVLEHPTWKRIEGALVEALRPFPEAAEAVAAALGDLEGDA